MRASVIFGPGSSDRDLRSFRETAGVTWQSGVPAGSCDADVLLILGGDGTVHRNLSSLLELQIPVLVVPRGSGNDFARGLGIDSSRTALTAWQCLTSGGRNVRPIDIGLIKALDTQIQHHFCTVAGVGLDGEVARRANRLPRWLRANGGYALTLLPSLFAFGQFRLSVIAEPGPAPSRSAFHPAVLAAFANTAAYGGGMKIAPRARMNDGLLDVCVIHRINRFKLFCAFPSVYFGRHLSIREIEYLQTPLAKVETERPLDVYADGEYVCRTPIEVSLKRHALPVVVPSGDPELGRC